MLIRIVGALVPVLALLGCQTDASPRGPAGSSSPDAALPPNVRVLSDDASPAGRDLVDLAERFVAYALGTNDSVTHAGEVELLIGGVRVGVTTLPDGAKTPRTLMASCPHGASAYAAATCPIDLFGPIRAAQINRTDLIYSADFAPVVCAPAREGRVPQQDVIVLRPAEEWRTCASDFAIALVTDGDGRLKAIDLTLSEP